MEIKKEFKPKQGLGVALRQLYPGAFTSYRGTVFRVGGISNDPMAGVNPDTIRTEQALDTLSDFPELTDKAFAKIRKEVRRDTGILLPDIHRIKLHIKVPGGVQLVIDEKIENVFCQNHNCGTLWKLPWLLRDNGGSPEGLPRCRLCGSRVTQAPIFLPVANPPDNKIPTIGEGGPMLNVDIRAIDTMQMFCHYKTPQDGCRAPGSIDKKCVIKPFEDKLGSLIQIDSNRPIESLSLCNPDCPKKLLVPYIPIRKPARQPGFWWKTDYPRESLNAPLTANSVHSYDDTYEDPETIEVNEVLQPMLGQFFNPEVVDLERTRFTRMKILETVYGYRMGGKKYGTTTSYIGADTRTVIGRVIDTKGFQVTIKPKIYDTVNKIKEKLTNTDDYEDEDILEIILHSLKHALLVLAPIHTGLDEQKFHGSFEINQKKDDDWAAKVYVYDTEDGGSGGFSTIMRNRDILEIMLDEIRLRRLYCPVRECKQACRHCIAIKNCGFVNRRLNRRLLIKSNIFQTG